MTTSKYSSLISEQRYYFEQGHTRPYPARVTALRKLKKALKYHEAELYEALKKDLGKNEYEAFVGEVAIVSQEIDYALKNLKSWMTPQKVSTPVVLLPGKSEIHPTPKGVVLIIAPWNYPLQLLMSPLIGALAAGNCAVLKPSELAPHTEQLIKKMMGMTFDPALVSVVTGDASTTQELLQERFNHIFFTGSPAVGKIIMKAAAEYLTPVTLELGGKSPCLIDKEANLQVAARRILWGKFFNAGQTCVAPDYLLVHESIKAPFVEKLKKTLQEFYGDNPQSSPDYGRIINEKHFDRLVALLQGCHVISGGDHNREKRFIAPTLIDHPDLNSKLMREEIFGPILPIITYKNLSEALQIIHERPEPLAFYLFSQNQQTINSLIEAIPFGGGCINDTLTHLGNHKLPFGGIGTSGMGAYNGKMTFDTFSHQKSLFKKPFWGDLSLRYPPYKDKLQKIKLAFKWL